MLDWHVMNISLLFGRADVGNLFSTQFFKVKGFVQNKTRRHDGCILLCRIQWCGQNGHHKPLHVTIPVQTQVVCFPQFGIKTLIDYWFKTWFNQITLYHRPHLKFNCECGLFYRVFILYPYFVSYGQFFITRKAK